MTAELGAAIFHSNIWQFSVTSVIFMQYHIHRCHYVTLPD